MVWVVLALFTCGRMSKRSGPVEKGSRASSKHTSLRHVMLVEDAWFEPSVSHRPDRAYGFAPGETGTCLIQNRVDGLQGGVVRTGAVRREQWMCM